MSVSISSPEQSAAEEVFGNRFGLAAQFVEHLATSGIERGLLGPREIPRLWGRHVLNCAVVEALIYPGAKVCDVGSGAGLPGVALAIARPDISMILIEPLERRICWLEEVVADLGLSNVEVRRARAEQLVGTLDADFVTARAVSALVQLAGLTMPLVGKRGTVLAIKGRSAEAEVAKASKIIAKLGGQSTDIVSLGAEILPEPTTVVRIVVRKSGR